MTELFLYQTLHLHKGRPRLVAEHIRALDQASQKIFGHPYSPDAKRLEARIVALAAAESYPDTVSGFVRIELLPNGTERLVPAGVSLYAGYALRSITPDAIVCQYTLPLNHAPTSAHEAATLLARQIAQSAGAGAAVECDSQGVLHTIDGAPLFAVRNKEVFTLGTSSNGDYPSHEIPIPSVERELGIRAVQAAGLQLSGEPALSSELSRYDELFSIDHRGVTALAHCDGNPYMSLMAERTAAAMEHFFRSRK